MLYYFDPHEIISSLVTPLMDASKRAREYIVEISLNDAPGPVVRRLSVPSNLFVGHFVYVLVYAMGWDGYHLTELTQGDTLWRSTKEKAMDAESDLDYEECYPGMKVRNSSPAPVPARLMIVVVFQAMRRFFGLSRILKIATTGTSGLCLGRTMTRLSLTYVQLAADSMTTSVLSAKCCTGFTNVNRHTRLDRVSHSVIAGLIGNPLTALSKTSSSVLGESGTILFFLQVRHLQ